MLTVLRVANRDRTAEIKAVELDVYELTGGGDVRNITAKHGFIRIFRNLAI